MYHCVNSIHHYIALLHHVDVGQLQVAVRDGRLPESVVLCTYVCVYIYIYIAMYVCIYIYIHTYMSMYYACYY